MYVPLVTFSIRRFTCGASIVDPKILGLRLFIVVVEGNYYIYIYACMYVCIFAKISCMDLKFLLEHLSVWFSSRSNHDLGCHLCMMFNINEGCRFFVV